jgi:hypothetical protein
VESSRILARELEVDKYKATFAANESLATFAPARCYKTLICTSGNSAASADKSDDFLP